MNISVVIGSFNQKDKLEKALYSYNEQTYPLDMFEIIVIDSGSKDGTDKLLQSINIKYKLIYKIINNKGKSHARNYGINIASGKIIILTDADIIADKNFIKEHYDAHETSNYTMCFEGLEYNIIDTGKPINKSNISPYIKKSIKNKQNLGWYYFISGNLSAPAHILKTNMFSEDFFGYGWEDIELGYRLNKNGIKLKYLDSAINYHFHTYNFKEELERKEKMGFEANLFIKKHPELKNWLGFHPLLMFIYKVIKTNKVFIGLLNTTSNKKGIGKLSRFILSEYYYRHGYNLGLKYGQKKENNKILKHDVSVIIVTYNNKEMLERCLDSIYLFSNDINLEIIIVDNHSQDGTAFLINQKYSNIKYIYLEDNYGFAKANNIGIMESNSKYILLLNNDTLLLNNLIKNMYDFMEANKDVHGCGPKLLDKTNKFQKQGSFLFNLYLKMLKKPVRVKHLPMTALFLRRDVIDKVGFLDEAFFFYNEDLDYSKRIDKLKFTIKYLPDISLVHYGRGSVDIANEKIIYESYKGGLYYVKKHYNFIIYIIYKLLVLIEMNIKILIYKITNKDTKSITALKMAKEQIFK